MVRHRTKFGTGVQRQRSDLPTIECSDPTRGLVFTADGSKLIGLVNDNVIRIWNLHDGKLLRELKGPQGNGNSITVSPDGQTILSTTDGDPTKGLSPLLTKWDLSSGQLLETQAADCDPKDQTLEVRYSPNGQSYATLCGVSHASQWAPDGLFKRRGYMRWYGHDLSYSADGQSVVLAGQGEIKGNPIGIATYWGVGDGAMNGGFDEVAEDEGALRRVAMSPDGQLGVLSNGGGVMAVWSAKTGSLLRKLKPPAGVEEHVQAVAFSPTKEIVASVAHNTIRLWDATTAEQLDTRLANATLIRALVFSPDGKWLVSGGQEGIQVWDVAQVVSSRPSSANTSNKPADKPSSETRTVPPTNGQPTEERALPTG